LLNFIELFSEETVNQNVGIALRSKILLSIATLPKRKVDEFSANVRSI